MISPVAFTIAAVPLAMYLLLVGRLRLARRPLVTTGWRDTTALGLAVMGLVVIGPMQLFFPTYAAARFAGWVWLMLLALYLLSLLLMILGCRPRLIVYGLGEEPFYRALETAAQRVDQQALWQGQVLTLPTAGLQLIAEPTGAQGVQSVVCASSLTSIAPWMQLEKEVVQQCRQLPAERRGWAGVGLTLAGASLLGLAVWLIAADPAVALSELREFLNR